MGSTTGRGSLEHWMVMVLLLLGLCFVIVPELAIVSIVGAMGVFVVRRVFRRGQNG